MRISLAQVDSRLGDLDHNFEVARDAVTRAVAQGADVVVFPELFVSGCPIQDDPDLTIDADDSRLQELSRAAGDVGVVIGFAESEPRGSRIFNSVGYYEAGRLVHLHRKLYLVAYGPFDERNHFSPGQTLRSFPVHGKQQAAVLCCNDAWQPQLGFLATQDGAQVLLVPSASAQSLFPDRYDNHEYWQAITRFYGRMYQLYVVFVNRVGNQGPFDYWGGSHVVDPWGRVVAEAPPHEDHLLTVDLDLSDVRRRRREVPLVREARLGMLRREIDRLLDEGGDL
ncbi:MAG: nitrilase-related carbon-nitrogen hydrolase [Nocardioides sp.]